MFVFVSKENKKLKEFTHQELNLPEEAIETEGIPEKFMVFQNYLAFFHFIPFWPIGKTYAFQKDGHTFRAPESIKEHIELEHPVKTPIHYYFGIFTLIAVFVAFAFLIEFIGNLLETQTSSEIDSFLEKTED